MRRFLFACLTVLLAASCSSGTAPEVPLDANGEADPVLVLGRELYANRCASCHGSDGGGRSGPRLNGGRVVERYPDPAEQVAYVAEGRGGMPGFGNTFSPEELEAVVAYTREVLNDIG